MSSGAWIVAHLAHFGEVAFEVDPKDFDSSSPILEIRRLTILILDAKGNLSLAKWFPIAMEISTVPLQIRREAIPIFAPAARRLEEKLVEMWTGLVTTAPPPPPLDGPNRDRLLRGGR